MSVLVPAKLRSESRQFAAYRSLKRRFPTLLLATYSHGILEQIVILKGGRPCVLDVEDDSPQTGEDSP